VGFPTTQGDTVTGKQGIGVKTPKAAAVADITIGLARLEHVPKGKILTNGLLSIMLAAGILTNTLLTGNVINVDGAAPKLHLRTAPPVTKMPITLS
jgi:hypothetical protein